ncbi:separin protein [Bonamia ostreae]|uniref:Separin protein n=1 Tax=Bonamia ostreae TaxID=126728 RepID=A0ABV2AQP4_9EUKA
MELLTNFLSGKNDLSKSISISRKVCKMKFLTGAAPVVYGTPFAQVQKHNFDITKFDIK